MTIHYLLFGSLILNWVLIGVSYLYLYMSGTFEIIAILLILHCILFLQGVVEGMNNSFSRVQQDIKERFFK